MKILIDKTFSKDSILRTCYSFANKFYFDINEHEGAYAVTVTDIARTEIPENFEHEFKNSLIDNELRIVIENKTKVIKETLIFAAMREAWSNSVDDK